MSLQDFINAKNGQTGVGDTSANKGQCVGLVEAFFDTLGLPHIWGNASDMPSDADLNVFNVIANTPTYLPPVGAAVVFPAGWEGSSVGHVALVAPGTTESTLVVFEANDRIGGGNGAARLHSFNYNTGLTGAQVAAGWPKFIVPKVLIPAPPPPPAAPVSSPEGTFNVVVALAGYTSAGLAVARTNSNSTVQPGNYHVFNQADGMVNVTTKPGEPGTWVNPADNKQPAAAQAPAVANYDGNAITIQPGWGLSNAAVAAGYPDANSPLRWTAIAKLNGSDDWQTYNSQLKAGMRIVVGQYTIPTTPVAPAPAPQPTAPVNPPVPTLESNTTYTKLSEPLNLVTKQTPTHVWMLDFKTYAEAHSALDLPQGSPVMAYGKAQRTDLDHPAYFMTAEDFGNADTAGVPANNRGINTVDLMPAPAPQPTPGAAKPVPVSTVADFDKRFNYTPFADPKWVTAPQLVSDIMDLRTVINPDGSVDFPYPSQQLLQNQSIQVSGTMTVGSQKYYRSVGSVATGMYYGIPAVDVTAGTGESPLLRMAAQIAGALSKFGRRK